VVEREWREARDLRTSRLALSLVLIAAAVLRFWALGRGIPYAVQVDEPEIVERAVGMMRSGSLHPHFFDYPALYIYLQLSVAVVLLACWMTVPLRGGRLGAALGAAAGCGAAFLICAPYTVLDLPGFLNSVARLAGEYRGPTPYAEPAWLLYLKYLLRHALGWPALLLAGGGMCLGIVRLIRGPGARFVPSAGTPGPELRVFKVIH
jgi:hypothetical protein